MESVKKYQVPSSSKLLQMFTRVLQLHAENEIAPVDRISKIKPSAENVR